MGVVLILMAGVGAFLFLAPAGQRLLAGPGSTLAPGTFREDPDLAGAADSPSAAAKPLSPAERVQRIQQVQAGCRTAAPARAVALVDSFPRWAETMLIAVACHTILAGMSAEQLRSSWGPPQHVVPNSTPFRPIETWQYDRGRGTTVSVLLWGRMVRSWQ